MTISLQFFTVILAIFVLCGGCCPDAPNSVPGTPPLVITTLSTKGEMGISIPFRYTIVKIDGADYIAVYDGRWMLYPKIPSNVLPENAK